jgi:HipA-like C-terminal domain
VPTTHILKPAVTGLDDHDLNEHLCLSAARIVGLSAASSQVGSFGAERVIVVERYDRRWTPDGTVSVGTHRNAATELLCCWQCGSLHSFLMFPAVAASPGGMWSKCSRMPRA